MGAAADCHRLQLPMAAREAAADASTAEALPVPLPDLPVPLPRPDLPVPGHDKHSPMAAGGGPVEAFDLARVSSRCSGARWTLLLWVLRQQWNPRSHR